MATLNEVADAFESKIGAINGVVFYSETAETPEAPPAGVSVELFFVNRRRITHGPSAMHEVLAELEISVPADRENWAAAIRLARELCDYQGASHGRSIESIVEADKTLGGVVESALYNSTSDENRKLFPDGERWTVAVSFKVKYKP